MKIFLVFVFYFFYLNATSQRVTKEEYVINKWTKSVVNVLCYPKISREKLLIVDSALKLGRIDSATHHFYVNQLVSSGSSGTAIWVTYQKHNFLISARHVFEDATAGVETCFNEIHIIENDTIHSIDLKKFEIGPYRTFASERGTPSDIIFVNNIKLYKFSSADDDIAIVNIDSSYYAYGIFKFLKSSGYKPIDVEDIDTVFKVRNKAEVIAIGYPNESITKIKNEKELPDRFALFTSPFFTIPIITRGTIYNVRKGKNSFEANIFTYHGFSGGPIINTKGKLIGITHGFNAPKKTASKGNYYEFHGEFKKSTLIMQLLRDLLVQIQSQQMQEQHF